MSQEAIARLAQIVSGSFRASPTDTLAEWCEREVYLDSKSTTEPGFWRMRKTPWVYRFLECAEDPDVTQCTAAKSSRSGFTEAYLNILRAAPSRGPGHGALILPSSAKARDVCERRVQPSLKRCAAEYVTGNRDDMGKSVIKLSNMDLYFAGAGTDTWGTEIWYRYVGLDEYDSHDHDEHQTNADLARSRVRNVDGGCVWVFGKVKTKSGPMGTEYLGGTQERPLVPCPHCDARIELCEGILEFKHLRGELGRYDDEEILKYARYVCPRCDGHIYEADKRQIVPAVSYVPAPRDPAAAKLAKETGDYFDPRHPTREGKRAFSRPQRGHVSLRISDFYCLHDDLTIGHMALKILAAANNPQKRKELVIEHFGTGWGEAATGVEETDVTGCREDYKRGEIPFEHDRIAFVSCQGDMQQDRAKLILTAWRDDGACAVVDWVELMSLDDLDEWLDRPRPIKGDPEGRTRAHDRGYGLIDSRYQRDEVFEYCRGSDWRLFPSAGVRNVDSIAYVVQKSKEWRGWRVPVYHYNDHAVKSAFYTKKIVAKKRPRFMLPGDVDEAFCSELSAERLESRTDKNGFESLHWVKRGGANDFGDCCKKGYIVWHLVEEQLQENDDEEE